MKIRAQVAMVMNLDKCIGCHTCSVTCKNTWTNRPGAEYIWFNNVETKPGIGYPKQWEDQEKFQGGWGIDKQKLQLKSGNRFWKYVNIFHNPDLPELEEYYEPWEYDYENLIQSPAKNHQPIAMPRSLITGKEMEIIWGPNWEDDLAGSNVTTRLDPNSLGLEQEIQQEFEKTFLFYLPRLCEHCLNPACVAACPSGAMYKRAEDGIVLVDQEACRSWRYCISSCPYKKVYYNWKTHKSEKCTFCYPRIEVGLPPVCAETCVGRIRYVGIVLYDTEQIKTIASIEDEKSLYQSQVGLFLDPWDEKVIHQAQLDGVPEDWIKAAQKSPFYQLVVNYRIALPLHPEYRTLPMVWYIPPLSPILKAFEGNPDPKYREDVFPAIDQMRIPIRYLANLLSAGNEDVIREVLKKMLIMRQVMRAKSIQGGFDDQVVKDVGLDRTKIEEMYRLLAIAKYKDRFVIPTSHKERGQDVYREQGSTGFELNDTSYLCFPEE